MSQALQIEVPIVHEHSFVQIKINATWKDGVGKGKTHHLKAFKEIQRILEPGAYAL